MVFDQKIVKQIWLVVSLVFAFKKAKKHILCHMKPLKMLNTKMCWLILSLWQHSNIFESLLQSERPH